MKCTNGHSWKKNIGIPQSYNKKFKTKFIWGMNFDYYGAAKRWTNGIPVTEQGKRETQSN